MTQRTYGHLAAGRQIPSDYHVVSSQLAYWAKRGFEVKTPLGTFHDAHSAQASLNCDDWEAFDDPDGLTYARYCEVQRNTEVHLGELLRRPLDPSSGMLQTYHHVLGPLRFACHGLQMVAAYLGCLAPSGKLTILFALQAADEMARVHCLARRLGQLRYAGHDVSADSRAIWEGEPCWQPVRAALERLLVTFDWAEAMVALNLAVKPALDELFFGSLANSARELDETMKLMLAALSASGDRQRRWSLDLVRHVVSAAPENRAVMAAALCRWRAHVGAVFADASTLLGGGESERVLEVLGNFWRALELEGDRES
jgi:toluene monooxygenase system protein E